MNLDTESGAEAPALHTLRDAERFRRGEASGVRAVYRRFGFMFPEQFKKEKVSTPVDDH